MFAVLSIAQIGLYVYLLGYFFSLGNGNHWKTFPHTLIVQLFLSLLMLFCFYMHYEMSSPFDDSKYFFVYEFIAIAGLVGFWLNKYIAHEDFPPVIRWIGSTSLGLLFWIALLTTVKFFPFILFTIFPFFGLLLAAPLLVLAMVIYEYRSIASQNTLFSPWRSILYGGITLICIQLLLNLITTSNWELVKLFNPFRDAIYF